MGRAGLTWVKKFIIWTVIFVVVLTIIAVAISLNQGTG
jgi:hypothetical protein